MPAERILVRLAIEPTLIDRAEAAIGDDTDFRTAVDTGVRRYLKRVEKHLVAAGLTSTEPVDYRMRPMTPITLAALERVSELTGISKPALIRACLTLLSRAGPA
jgi:hypothetical protein